jgi:hypothetical protein
LASSSLPVGSLYRKIRLDRRRTPILFGYRFHTQGDWAAGSQGSEVVFRQGPIGAIDLAVKAQDVAEGTATGLTELDLPLDWTEQRRLLAS